MNDNLNEMHETLADMIKNIAQAQQQKDFQSSGDGNNNGKTKTFEKHHRDGVNVYNSFGVSFLSCWCGIICISFLSCGAMNHVVSMSQYCAIFSSVLKDETPSFFHLYTTALDISISDAIFATSILASAIVIFLEIILSIITHFIDSLYFLYKIKQKRYQNGEC